jgi:cysteinyl-tRNA synthetase
MEKVLLGLPFDIHTGGIDLKFPHHEDEIAQSKAGYGIEPTVFWCHNEFLEVEGQKMSKSLGNFFTVRDLIEQGISTVDLRFAMLSAHYRSVYNYTATGLSSAQKARKRVQEYIYELLANESIEGKSEKADELRDNVYSELANDLHTPKALAHIFTFINNNHVAKLDPADRFALIELFRKLDEVFVAWEFELPTVSADSIPGEVVALAEERLTARANKDWAKSDELRNKISELGYAVKDSKGGYELEKS